MHSHWETFVRNFNTIGHTDTVVSLSQSIELGFKWWYETLYSAFLFLRILKRGRLYRQQSKPQSFLDFLPGTFLSVFIFVILNCCILFQKKYLRHKQIETAGILWCSLFHANTHAINIKKIWYYSHALSHQKNMRILNMRLKTFSQPFNMRIFFFRMQIWMRITCEYYNRIIIASVWTRL